jgi:hypothetical protein
VCGSLSVQNALLAWRERGCLSVAGVPHRGQQFEDLTRY